MMWIIYSFTTLVCCAISPVFTVYRTYKIQAVFPAQFMRSQKISHQKILRLTGHPVLVNITSLNLTTGAVRMTTSWHKEDLEKYGDPIDIAQFADDIFVFLGGLGSNPSRFQLNAPPPPPTSLSTSHITSNSIIITWKRPTFFEIDFYQVQLSNSSKNATWRNFKKVNGGKEETILNGLESDTNYFIRLQSANRHGIGARNSSILNVRTKEKPIASPTNDNASARDHIAIIIVVIIVIVVVVLAKKEENPYKESIPGVPFQAIRFNSGENKTFCPTGDTDGPEQQYFSWNEISRDDLTLGDIIGEGAFGDVVKAVWSDKQSNTEIPVAVKTVKEIATENDRKELLKELKLMADVAQHPNVVNLLGACSKGGPLLVIVEFCEHGNLLSYIRNHRKDLIEGDRPFTSSLDPYTRARFAYDVSKGMSHLEKKKIVHRDLAARNVLLGRNKIGKVSDFGLSRDIYEVGLYRKTTAGRLPIKWMAIESLLEGTYTCKSDVWSFGILFWEIETAGMLPYPGITGPDLLPYLRRGYRLPKPTETLHEVYEIIKTCWGSNPDERPSFEELETQLACFMEQSAYLPVVADEDNTDDLPALVHYTGPIEENDFE